MIAREPGGKCGWWCVWGDDSAVARRGTRDGTDSRDVGFIEASFLPFIRGVRSARSRSRATRGFGRWDRFHPHAHTERGFGRPVDFVRSFVRSVVATRTRDVRRDDPNHRKSCRSRASPFAVGVRRARDRVPSRRPRGRTRRRERDTGGRARGMENPRGIGIRTCGIGLAVHNSRMYPPSHEELVGNLECVDRSDG